MICAHDLEILAMTGPFFVLECIYCEQRETRVPTEMRVGEVLDILEASGFKLEVHYINPRDRVPS